MGDRSLKEETIQNTDGGAEKCMSSMTGLKKPFRESDGFSIHFYELKLDLIGLSVDRQIMKNNF